MPESGTPTIVKLRMRTLEKINYRPVGLARYFCALALLAAGFTTTAFAQQAGGQRSARSLTSEDLLNRPAAYLPPAASTPSVSPASKVVRSAGSTFYRDPAGAFTLSFPNSNWKINNRAGSIYNQRSFRRIEEEGFASATASVYVLTDPSNLSLINSVRLDSTSQREIAATIATQFLSGNASLVSVEPLFSKTRAGLHIVADQAIARHVMVRASINVFEQQGKLFVVVCCSSLETFDSSLPEFDAITNSLASSAMRS